MTNEIKKAAQISGNPYLLTGFSGVVKGEKFQTDRQHLAEIIISANSPLVFTEEWEIADGRRGGATLVVGGNVVGTCVDGLIVFAKGYEP